MATRALRSDAPTAARDPVLEKEVVKVIKALADEGRTMIMAPHDMKIAADCSDRVIFLHQGRIDGHGSQGDLFGTQKSGRMGGFRTATAA